MGGWRREARRMASSTKSSMSRAWWLGAGRGSQQLAPRPGLVARMPQLSSRASWPGSAAASESLE